MPLAREGSRQTPEGASGMHISGGVADDDYCTSSTPTRRSGPTSDGGVINEDDVSEVGGLAFGARGVPASETAGAIAIGMTTSARGGGAAGTPGNSGDPTQNVGTESDICAVMAAGTVRVCVLIEKGSCCETSVVAIQYLVLQSVVQDANRVITKSG